MYSIHMRPTCHSYRCRLCGSASYQRLTHRGPGGAMQYSGLYRCSGCSVTFADRGAWHEGPSTGRTQAPVLKADMTGTFSSQERPFQRA